MKKIFLFLSFGLIFNVLILKEGLITKEIVNTTQQEEVYFYNEPREIIGEIKFVRFKQVNKIIYGTDDATLNMQMVGLHELSENLFKTPNNIILAAHNRKGLFRVLEKLKINDVVLLNKEKFKVKKIEKHLKDEKLFFILPLSKRIITLITCIEKNEKRLVITLEESKKEVAKV